MSNNSNNENNNFAAELEASFYTASGIKPVMFNGLVNKSYKRDSTRIAVSSFIKVPKKLDGPVDVHEVVGYAGNFKTLVRASREYGVKGLINNDRIFSVAFFGTITKNGEKKGFNFVFYKNGKIRFSGGFVGLGTDPSAEDLTKQVELIRKTIVDNYTRKQDFLYNPLEFNNVTGQIQVPGIISDDSKAKIMKLVYPQNRSNFPFVKRDGNTTTGGVRWDKELMDNLYLYTEGGLTLVISTKGVIQINGASDPSTLIKLYNKEVVPIIEYMYNKDLIRRTDNGSYPIEMSKKTTRMAKRLENKPAPELGKSTTTCPKTRRPDPYTMQGKCKPGFYVKPNPQLQPCCYKIPKSIKFSRNKVENTFNIVNTKVPTTTKTIFGIGFNKNNKKNNVTNRNLNKNNLYFSNDPKMGFKISGRQCSRFSKPALINIASRMGITSIGKTITVPELCSLIRKKGVEIGANLTKDIYGEFKVVGKIGRKEVSLFIHRGVLRIGGQVCSTYKKATLISLANNIGVPLEPEMTIKDICDSLTLFVITKKSNLKKAVNNRARERVNRLERAERNRNERATREREQAAKNLKNEQNKIKINHLTKIRMTPELIKEDVNKLLGKKFITSYKKYLSRDLDGLVREIMTTFIKELSSGDIDIYDYKGVMVPYKSETDELKKDLVLIFKRTKLPLYTKELYTNKLKLLIPEEISKYSKIYNISNNKKASNDAIKFLSELILRNNFSGNFNKSLNTYINVKYKKKSNKFVPAKANTENI